MDKRSDQPCRSQRGTTSFFLKSQIEEYKIQANQQPLRCLQLIPEFFSTSEFLRNSDGIQLGRRQDGTRIGNVILPPWASDEDDFIQKHRAALESEYVSQNIHSWIDLIFGYKQRGENSVRADNVFHPLTYEGAVNIDEIADPMENILFPHNLKLICPCLSVESLTFFLVLCCLRMAILMQINEFGQTPHQIFTSPHPQRFSRDEREKMMKSANLTNQNSSTTPPPSQRSSFSGSATTLSRTSSGGSSSLSSSFIIEEAPRSILTSSFGGGIRRPSQDDLPSIGYSTPARAASRTLGTPAKQETAASSFGDSFGELLSSHSALGESPILELDLAGLSLSSNGSAPSSTAPMQPAKSVVADLEVDDMSVWASVETLTASDSFRLHRDIVTSVCLSPNGQTMYSVSQDSTLKIYSLADSRQLRNISISQLALSSCALTPDATSVIISSWDNSTNRFLIRDFPREPND